MIRRGIIFIDGCDRTHAGDIAADYVNLTFDRRGADVAQLLAGQVVVAQRLVDELRDVPRASSTAATSVRADGMAARVCHFPDGSAVAPGMELTKKLMTPRVAVRLRTSMGASVGEDGRFVFAGVR